MNNKIIILLLALTSLSCSKETLEQALSPRTVLIYMAADNNLYKNAQADLAEMLSCTAPVDGTLLVYVDVPEWSSASGPQLLRLERGKASVVKQYAQQNSASGAVLRAVVEDAVAGFAAQSYGLVLWSHGTGWLPQGVFESLEDGEQEASPSRALSPLRALSFGKDNGSEMGITELAEALPLRFEFIIFDACLMGGIEVLYELKDKANVMVASPTETLVAGMPYTEIIPYLFGDAPRYVELATAYMSYYRQQSGVRQSATIAVVDAHELQPLAALLRELLRGAIAVEAVDKSSIQQYRLQAQAAFYDLQDFLEQLLVDQAALASLRQQLAKLVVYHDFTPYFLSELAITRSCGISCYIPLPDNALMNEGYRQAGVVWGEWVCAGAGVLRCDNAMCDMRCATMPASMCDVAASPEGDAIFITAGKRSAACGR